MLESINNWDAACVLWVNELHMPFWDKVMSWASHTGIWIPFYAFLIVLLWRIKGRASVWYLIGIALVVVLSDQITSTLMKPYFERLRPCHSPHLQGLLALPDGCGGKYGFASSHAANTFGLAMFWWLALHKQYNTMYLLFFWGTFVSFSRVYLAAHYPTDVLVGALIGAMSALLVFYFPQKILKV